MKPSFFPYVFTLYRAFGFYSDFTTAEPSMEPRTESSAKSNTAAIAGAIAAVITLLVIIIVVVCVLKKRNRKPLKLSKGFEGVHFTAVSMRDRIRAESMRALDESKVLSLFNPDDMKQLPLTSIEYVRDLGSGNFGLVFLGMRTLGPRHTMRHITALNSLRLHCCCDKAACARLFCRGNMSHEFKPGCIRATDRSNKILSKRQ